MSKVGETGDLGQKKIICVSGFRSDPIFYAPTLTLFIPNSRLPTVIGLNDRVFTNQSLKNACNNSIENTTYQVKIDF